MRGTASDLIFHVSLYLDQPDSFILIGVDFEWELYTLTASSTSGKFFLAVLGMYVDTENNLSFDFWSLPWQTHVHLGVRTDSLCWVWRGASTLGTVITHQLGNLTTSLKFHICFKICSFTNCWKISHSGVETQLNNFLRAAAFGLHQAVALKDDTATLLLKNLTFGRVFWVFRIL